MNVTIRGLRAEWNVWNEYLTACQQHMASDRGLPFHAAALARALGYTEITLQNVGELIAAMRGYYVAKAELKHEMGRSAAFALPRSRELRARYAAHQGD